MTIQEAVEIIVQHVRDTGKTAPDAVRATWEQIAPFSEEDAKTLMQQALASRISQPLTGRTPSEEGRGRTVVAVTSYRRAEPLERRIVTCQVLQDVRYTVNGASKAVATFTRYDLTTKIEQADAIIGGFKRYKSVWQFALDLLVRFDKPRIEDLGEGEQMKIARMLTALRNENPEEELRRLVS